MSEPSEPSNGGDQSGRDTRGRFDTGNNFGRGRAAGSRNRATILAAAVIEGQAELLAAKCVRMALEGNEVALRLCIERLIPRCREKPVALDLPSVAAAPDVLEAQSRVIEAMATGELTPAEAAAVGVVLEGARRAIELNELEIRIAAIEGRLGGGAS